MSLQSPPVFRADELVETEPRLLQLLTSGFRVLHDALRAVPDRSIRSGSFMSAASGVSSVSIKSPLSQRPRHLTVSIRREDLADFSAAWSWWHQVDGEQVSLKFIGLPASTRIAYSVEFL